MNTNQSPLAKELAARAGQLKTRFPIFTTDASGACMHWDIKPGSLLINNILVHFGLN